MLLLHAGSLRRGPSVLVLDGTMQMHLDCSWQPTPAGHFRCPDGVATAPYPRGYSDATVRRRHHDTICPAH